jgi:hypothetical protein
VQQLRRNLTLVEQAKIEAVMEYLQWEFPGFQVDNVCDFDRVSHKFSVDNGSKFYIINFERIFLENTSDIKTALQNRGLSKFMRLNEGEQILVTQEGIKIS